MIITFNMIVDNNDNKESDEAVEVVVVGGSLV